MRYYEERLTDGRHDVIVCVPHSEYSAFLQSIARANSDRRHGSWTLTSLRPNVGRLTKGAISLAEFRGAFFD